MIPPALEPTLRDTLFRGGYNLLLGSGVTLDSHNGLGQRLRSAEQLRSDLCRTTGAPPQTTLTRVYSLLDASQIDNEITRKLSQCKPSVSLQVLPRFLWRRILTFNVDDCLENLYAGCPERKQKLIPINFDAPFEPTPARDEVQTVHLHGWVRQANSGYVFSAAEYSNVMRGLNPWMHLLSEILATESFIISGTSLNETDLEFYLSHRTKSTPRRDRAPSLFVTPNDDVVTRSDCERYGLVLVKAKFGDFLEWLHAKFPAPPTLSELIVPDTAALFAKKPSPRSLIRFFSDFELVQSAELPRSNIPTPFLYGREPEWRELHEHLDIERQANTPVSVTVSEELKGKPEDRNKALVLLADAGTGKTTCIKRVGLGLAALGRPVLSVRAISRIDTEAAKECLSALAVDVVMLVDGFADYAEQLADLMDDPSVSARVVVLGAERSYRKEYLDVVLSTRAHSLLHLLPFSLHEIEQLIEQYRQFGLLGLTDVVRNPREFARRLLKEPVTVSICRIMNDFRPLDGIVDSLWKAASPNDIVPYLAVALSQYCHRTGLLYSILQALSGPTQPIRTLFEPEAPLRLAVSELNDDYVLTINAAVGERILHRASRRHPETLLETFKCLAKALSTHVNRNAIKRRSPEARLAGRLFDTDKIVKPLLGDQTDDFFVSSQPEWSWNSRYWEQRALLTVASDVSRAVQYARHAVAIEKHPFPLTTLGKLLLIQMEHEPLRGSELFGEAFSKLSEAIEIEAFRSRITVHPFATLLGGATKYVDGGGSLSVDQRRKLSAYGAEARFRFAKDPLLTTVIQQLDGFLR